MTHATDERQAGTHDAMAERMRKVCELIVQNSGEPLPLKTLAELVQMSPFYLQRSFKAIVGVTPKEFQTAQRLQALKSGLKSKRSVTEAIYEAGFGSSSRVYELVDTSLGMTPQQYRRGGRGLAISYAFSETALGLMMIAATDRGICSIQFGATHAELESRMAQEFPEAQRTPMARGQADVFAAWMEAMRDYLSGRQPHLDLPLDIRGTAFQRTVWDYLRTIPYGQLQSYTEVARGIGRPSAVRAVASACAGNIIALAIPCHRVIRGDGAMGGYRWGVERKRALIDNERAPAESML